MKKFKLSSLILLMLAGLFFTACEEEEPETIVETRIVEKEVKTYNVTLNFHHLASGDTVELNTTGMPYTKSFGEMFKVSRLRYLVSDFTFHRKDGSSIVTDEYHFVTLTDPNSTTTTLTTKIPEGDYRAMSFTFGFDRMDNLENYPDLNQENFAWPMMLGGGYHFMQLEGKYDDNGSEKDFATHMGTARRIYTNPSTNKTDTTFEDNSFIAYPSMNDFTVASDFTIHLNMNIEQWYTNPYNWSFDEYSVTIMPNYDAQRKLNLNGPTVFTVNM
jgi:hypothetical protein